MSDPEQRAREVLVEACARAGVDAERAETMRAGENTLFRLRNQVIARVSRPGQNRAARREVDVARWMAGAGIPAVELADTSEQPIEVGERAVTFWRELPAHEPGTPTELAGALRRLHQAPLPAELDLGALEPFVRLEDRIEQATTLTGQDRDWMRRRLAGLRERWDGRPMGLEDCVIHGDAWIGNVATLTDRTPLAGPTTVFLDLERTSVGPPEWDLVHTAIKHYSFGWISLAEYRDFAGTYGHDVTGWAGYELFRDIREFRMTCMAVQTAAEQPDAESQAAHRLACLQGKLGARPWSGWATLP